MLDISAVSVFLMIIAICDIPRQELSLRERVYIHNTYVYEKQKVVFWNMMQISSSFQDNLCLIPVQLGDRIKDSLTSNNNHNQ